MANLDYLNEKSIEEDCTIVRATEELDKLNDGDVSEGDTSSIVLLVLCSFIPMAILIILFTFSN